jgi:D-alanine-D-alanine ligase
VTASNRLPPVSLPDRVRLVVLYGGQSAEHDVSRVSARHVLAALDPDRYDIVPIGIGRDGTWHLPVASVAELTGPTADAALPVRGEATGPHGVLADPIHSDLPTVVLPVLHGPNGEDGTVAGMMELAGVPYVGSGVLGSSLSMDKAKAKEVLAANGIAQARYRAAAEHEMSDDLLDDIGADLGFPLFVKPSNMGSSVGVSRVTGRDGLDGGVAGALRHDVIVVFEEAIVGREIEIGVLGNTELWTSAPGEIVPAAEFYDYNDKYHDGAAELIIPAHLDGDEVDRLAGIARRTYRALRAEVLARVDLFYEEGGRGFLVNEINTFPGFTPISMFPMLWAHSGVGYSELLDRMVSLALERHERGSRRKGAPTAR